MSDEIKNKNAYHRVLTFMFLFITIRLLTFLLELGFSSICYVLGIETVISNSAEFYGLMTIFTLVFWMFDLRIGFVENILNDNKKHKNLSIWSEEN